MEPYETMKLTFPMLHALCSLHTHYSLLLLSLLILFLSALSATLSVTYSIP